MFENQLFLTSKLVEINFKNYLHLTGILKYNVHFAGSVTSSFYCSVAYGENVRVLTFPLSPESASLAATVVTMKPGAMFSLTTTSSDGKVTKTGALSFKSWMYTHTCNQGDSGQK